MMQTRVENVENLSHYFKLRLKATKVTHMSWKWKEMKQYLRVHPKNTFFFLKAGTSDLK